ncbi:hypothetical protein EV641_109230 [Rhodococcus sp. SMB37]|uniref:hypothetical protein n=1 Tax=Rhodococcus sp. SMB37 TaxID=2512213 RepID=UPI0010435932|nr:hypothetical protein [Rhodococcus sp. SMB37]TCN51839.1 hypothetical protein EV641_109230 [Rhodococcus sp. SMB37]
MSILTRPLTEHELEAAGIEPAPVVHETFTQMFTVDRGELEIVDDTEEDDIPPKPMRIGLAVWVWGLTMGAAFGTVGYLAVVTS